MAYLVSAFVIAGLIIFIDVVLWFRKKLTFDAFYKSFVAFIASAGLVWAIQSSLDTSVYKTHAVLAETKPLIVFQINGRDVLATRTQANPQTFDYMYTFLVPDELGAPKRIDGFVPSDQFRVVFINPNQEPRLETYSIMLTAEGSRQWLLYVVPIIERPILQEMVLYIQEEMVLEIPKKGERK